MGSSSELQLRQGRSFTYLRLGIFTCQCHNSGCLTAQPYRLLYQAFVAHSPTTSRVDYIHRSIVMFKVNRSSQGSVVDPSDKTMSQALRAFLSGASLDKDTPDTITLTVGTKTQQTWTLPKSLLAKQSLVFRSLFTEDIVVSEKELPTITPQAFADFVNFLRSSIYATNTKAEGYSTIRANVDACILGIQLGAEDYRIAALRTLYKIFEPQARSPLSNTIRSVIRARDIEYVCVHAGAGNLAFSPCDTDATGYMRGLRMMCFDALAAHWTQRNVVFFSMQSETHKEWLFLRKNTVLLHRTTTWLTVLARFPEFRARLVGTKGIVGEDRAGLLRDEDDYIFLLGEHGDGGFLGDGDTETDGENRPVAEFSRRNGILNCRKLTIRFGKGSSGSSSSGSSGHSNSNGGGGVDSSSGSNGGVQEETAQTEEDMRPKHIEDVDADFKQEEKKDSIRTESGDGEKLKSE
jgi:hypothetical protein